MQKLINNGRLVLVKSKIKGCERFLAGIDSREHPEFFRSEATQDLHYWQSELDKLQIQQ